MTTPVYQLSDSYIEESAALDPATATYLGIAGYDHLMTDFSPAGHAARAELDRSTLAALNALYLVLLLAGGFVLDTVHLPRLVAAVIEFSPATAMTSALRDALDGSSVDGGDWVVLVAWAVAAPLLAARSFRWDAD